MSSQSHKELTRDTLLFVHIHTTGITKACSCRLQEYIYDFDKNIIVFHLVDISHVIAYTYIYIHCKPLLCIALAIIMQQITYINFLF